MLLFSPPNALQIMWTKVNYHRLPCSPRAEILLWLVGIFLSCLK
uniref:Uncharacterized protein n=1 Tax=Rhizophora mucronata TaxID=61149 RepID=A0A2P2P706_RHIMU